MNKVYLLSFGICLIISSSLIVCSANWENPTHCTLDFYAIRAKIDGYQYKYPISNDGIVNEEDMSGLGNHTLFPIYNGIIVLQSESQTDLMKIEEKFPNPYTEFPIQALSSKLIETLEKEIKNSQKTNYPVAFHTHNKQQIRINITSIEGEPRKIIESNKANIIFTISLLGVGIIGVIYFFINKRTIK